MIREYGEIKLNPEPEEVYIEASAFFAPPETDQQREERLKRDKRIQELLKELYALGWSNDSDY